MHLNGIVAPLNAEKEVSFVRKNGDGRKLSTILAETLERRIILSGWPTGQLLGTEPELVQSYGVARGTLREALRQLELRGILNMRRGPGGGLYVSSTPTSAFISSLATFIELIDYDVTDAIEARSFFILSAVALACERIDDEGIILLRGYKKQLDEASSDLEEIFRLHTSIRSAVLEIASSSYMSLITKALIDSGISLLLFQNNTDKSHMDTIRKSGDFKKQLIEAIIAGDKAGAQIVAMQDIQVQIKGYKPALKTARAPRGRLRDSGLLEWRKHGKIKLWHALALEISEMIQVEGMSENDPLGTEDELIERYSISRAIFREAVRLLELYSVVKTHRGDGRKVSYVVGQPNFRPLLDSLTQYIKCTDICIQDAHEAIEALELGSISLCVERASPEEKAKIENALQHLEKINDESEIAREIADFHHLINSCGDNKVISLLSQLMYHIAIQNRSMDNLLGNLDFIKHNHRSLVRAIQDGDTALARRAIVVHHKILRQSNLHRN